MEKKIIKDYLYSIYNIYTEEDISISDIGCELLPTDRICVYCDEDSASLEIYRFREETDEEVCARHDKELKKALRIAQQERENYNRTKEAYFRMKQKFEPDNE